MSRNSDKIIQETFTDIKLDLNNLWVYQIRKNIFKVLQENAVLFRGKVLDVGCGIMPYKKTILRNKNVTEYIGLDLENTSYYADIKPDLLWNGQVIPLDDNTVDCIVATEVLEHCYSPDIILREIHRVLKPGGLFFCTVPFIWHLHEIPFDEYRYTPFSLEKHLKACNFNDIVIKPLGGWDSALSQLLGLWVTYRPMKRINKSILLRLVRLVIGRLEKTDKVPGSYNNSSNSMISGLSALSYKKTDQ